MNILFTKKSIDKKLVSEYLGNQFSYDFTDVIKIKHLEVKPFDLKGKSLIFTSVNGVESFFQNNFKPNEKFTSTQYNKIYCVGIKTKNALRKYGFGTYKVKKHAHDLAEFIIQNSHGERFLHFCGNLALDVIDCGSPLQNISYKKVEVYETSLLYPVMSEEFGALVFFSPSGVRSYAKNNPLEGKKIFSIGHTTEKEIRNFTKQQIYTSHESNLDDLLQLIVKKLS